MSTTDSDKPAELKATLEMLSLNLLDDPERPMRTGLDADSVRDLAVSIKEVGIIEPIIVRQRNNRYEIIAGHRRSVAAEVAGLVVVPCRIVEASDEQVEMMKIHENLYRLDVNPIEEAHHYNRLIQDMKLTPRRIAEIIKRSERYVYDRLNILSYPQQLLDALDSGSISFSVAREFARLTDERQLGNYIRYAAANGQTAAGAKKWVEDSLKPAYQPPTSDPGEPGQQPMFVQSNDLGPCFFCQEPTHLNDCQTVYVHDGCIERRNQIMADSGSTERPAP